MPLVSLRARFDDAAQLRGHLRYTKSAAILLLPRVDLAPQTSVHLEVELSRGPHYLTLQGSVVAHGRQGSIFNVPDVAPLHGRAAWLRRERRFPLSVVGLVSASGIHDRVELRDVSFGGARIDLSYAVGTELELRIPGEDGVLRARVTWRTGSGCGLRWVRTHASTRLGALRLLQRGVGEWDRIPLLSHPAACACCLEPSLGEAPRLHSV